MTNKSSILQEIIKALKSEIDDLQIKPTNNITIYLGCPKMEKKGAELIEKSFSIKLMVS